MAHGRYIGLETRESVVLGTTSESRVHGSRLVPRSDLAYRICVLDPAGRILNLEKLWYVSAIIRGWTGVRNEQGSSYIQIGLMYSTTSRPASRRLETAGKRYSVHIYEDHHWRVQALLASNPPAVRGPGAAPWYGRSMARVSSPVAHT